MNTPIKVAKLPNTDLGDDPNDHRYDPDYVEKIQPFSPDTNSIPDCISIIDAAILKLMNDDAGAHWEQDVIEAARELYKIDLSEFYRKRNEIKAANKDTQITDWTKVVKNNGDSEESNGKSDELVNLARQSCELFHDDRGNTYATFQQEDHFETWALGSEGFSKWLSYKSFTDLSFSPSQAVFAATLTTLKGFAIHEGEEQEVYLRCAPTNGGFLIDQTNNEWTAIKITAQGWAITKQPDRKFIRSNTATALPDPVDGDYSLFWNHVNVPVEYQTLITAYMLESWRPQTPYVILELCGEQGSAKSTTHTDQAAIRSQQDTAQNRAERHAGCFCQCRQ